MAQTAWLNVGAMLALLALWQHGSMSKYVHKHVHKHVQACHHVSATCVRRGQLCFGLCRMSCGCKRDLKFSRPEVGVC